MNAIEKAYFVYCTGDNCVTCKHHCVVPVEMWGKKSQCVECNPERWCNVLKSQTGIQLKLDVVKQIVKS